MLAAGNDGSVYALEKTGSYKRYDADVYLEEIESHYPNRLDGVAEYLEFINAFYKEAENHGIRYYARKNQ